MDKVIIFDTTLRDGEQAAGASLNTQEKLEIARHFGRGEAKSSLRWVFRPVATLPRRKGIKADLYR